MFAPRQLLPLLFTLLFATVLRLGAAELTEGISRAELEALVGKPISVMQRGDKVVLAYPKKGRAEFVGGKLVYFERIEILDTPAQAAVPAPASAPAAGTAAAAPSPTVASTAAVVAQGSTQAPVKKLAKASSSPASAASKTPAEKLAAPAKNTPVAEDAEDEEAPTKLSPEEQARMAQKDAEMAKMQEKFLNGEPLVPQESSSSSASAPWISLLLEALFKIPITVLVLKFAFKWSDVDADWSQMWLPAAVDTLVRSLVQGVAMAAWNLDMLFYVDEGLAFFALLYTLIKTTHACTLMRAVGVAFAAKLASIVVWAILSVFILGLLFSNSHP